MCVLTPSGPSYAAWDSTGILNKGSAAVLVSANEINAEQEKYVAEDKKMERILSALIETILAIMLDTVIALTSVGRIHYCCFIHAAMDSAHDMVVFIRYGLEILTTFATEGTP